MTINKVYLHSLLATKDFQDLLDEIEKSRPSVPAYDFTNDNAVEEWKSKSYSQMGFDLVFSRFRRIK